MLGSTEMVATPEDPSNSKRVLVGPSRQGFTIFFTGLSGAGKSELATVLRAKLQERDRRHIVLLDGDIVRKQLSPELGFSRQDRDTNIRRIGSAASNVAKNGGIAICAAIAPYDRTRKEVRALVEGFGRFVLVYVSTPVSICEQRDPKGLYARARAGIIPNFTGISDPYEVPPDAEIVIDTGAMNTEDATQEILMYLKHRGLLEQPNKISESGAVM
jgi:sulfate adenylyltransferase